MRSLIVHRCVFSSSRSCTATTYRTALLRKGTGMGNARRAAASRCCCCVSVSKGAGGTLARGDENKGAALLTYLVLMAADILLYQVRYEEIMDGVLAEGAAKGVRNS